MRDRSSLLCSGARQALGVALTALKNPRKAEFFSCGLLIVLQICVIMPLTREACLDTLHILWSSVLTFGGGSFKKIIGQCMGFSAAFSGFQERLATDDAGIWALAPKTTQLLLDHEKKMIEAVQTAASMSDLDFRPFFRVLDRSLAGIESGESEVSLSSVVADLLEEPPMERPIAADTASVFISIDPIPQAAEEESSSSESDTDDELHPPAKPKTPAKLPVARLRAYREDDLLLREPFELMESLVSDTVAELLTYGAAFESEDRQHLTVLRKSQSVLNLNRELSARVNPEVCSPLLLLVVLSRWVQLRKDRCVRKGAWVEELCFQGLCESTISQQLTHLRLMIRTLAKCLVDGDGSVLGLDLVQVYCVFFCTLRIALRVLRRLLLPSLRLPEEADTCGDLYTDFIMEICSVIPLVTKDDPDSMPIAVLAHEVLTTFTGSLYFPHGVVFIADRVVARNPPPATLEVFLTRTAVPAFLAEKLSQGASKTTIVLAQLESVVESLSVGDQASDSSDFSMLLCKLLARASRSNGAHLEALLDAVTALILCVPGPQITAVVSALADPIAKLAATPLPLKSLSLLTCALALTFTSKMDLSALLRAVAHRMLEPDAPLYESLLAVVLVCRETRVGSSMCEDVLKVAFADLRLETLVATATGCPGKVLHAEEPESLDYASLCCGVVELVSAQIQARVDVEILPDVEAGEASLKNLYFEALSCLCRQVPHKRLLNLVDEAVSEVDLPKIAQTLEFVGPCFKLKGSLEDHDNKSGRIQERVLEMLSGLIQELGSMACADLKKDNLAPSDLSGRCQTILGSNYTPYAVDWSSENALLALSSALVFFTTQWMWTATGKCLRSTLAGILSAIKGNGVRLLQSPQGKALRGKTAHRAAMRVRFGLPVIEAVVRELGTLGYVGLMPLRGWLTGALAENLVAALKSSTEEAFARSMLSEQVTETRITRKKKKKVTVGYLTERDTWWWFESLMAAAGCWGVMMNVQANVMQTGSDTDQDAIAQDMNMMTADMWEVLGELFGMLALFPECIDVVSESDGSSEVAQALYLQVKACLEPTFTALKLNEIQLMAFNSSVSANCQHVRSEVRLAATKTLHKCWKLHDRTMMPCFTAALQVIGDLKEDPVELVEQEAHEWQRTLRSKTGEDVNKRMR